MSDSPPPSSRLTKPSVAALIATAVVFLVLAVRQQVFVHRYAVDVLFMDTWDLYRPMLHGQGWWASFDQQHGPHRQGLGGWAMRATADLTGWDSRADAAVISWTLTAAVPLGVLLAWRCGVRGWPLVGVPVLYLNARQSGFFIAMGNPAHGAIPVLLFTAYGLAWFARATAVRLSLLVVLTAGLIFTGFGLFVGLLTPAVLSVEVVTAARGGDRRRAAAAALAVAATAATWAAFLHGYSTAEAAGTGFHFLYGRSVEYLYFIGVMLANQVGVDTWDGGPGPGTIAIGLALAALELWVCIARGRRVLRAGVPGDRASVVIFCLAAYGVVYTTQAALGRAPDGWQLGAASRYVTLGIPATVAVLLHLALSARPVLRWGALAFAGVMAAGTVSLNAGDLRAARSLHNGCIRWAWSYRTTHDQAAADRASHYQVYPGPIPADTLAYLERNRLNLFAAPPPPGTSAR